MLKIECDRCDKPFEVETEKAGQKVPCPHCGDINRVPAEPTAENLPSAAEPETTVRIVRPAMFRAHPFRYLFIVLMFFTGLAMAVSAWMEGGFPRWTAWAGLPLSLFAFIWWCQWWLTTHLWLRLTVTNKRVIRHEGIIRRHTSEVLHDHVRNVLIKQNVLQRILKVGYIGIASAGSEGTEIEINDIPGPFTVKAIIDEYRKM